MNNKTNILGVDIDNINLDDAMYKVKGYLQNEGTNVLISVDEGILLETQEQEDLIENMKVSDLILPEGISVYWAADFMGTPFLQRDILDELFLQMLNFMNENKKTLYLVGESPDITESYRFNIESKYPNIEIIGYFAGNFDTIEEDNIINDINIHTPDLLLVDLENVKQERWLCGHKNKLNVKLAVGTGLTFRSIIGYYPEPGWMKGKAKWLYRILNSSNGIKTLLKNSYFRYKIKQQIEKRKKNDGA